MREGELAYFVAEAPVYGIRGDHIISKRNGIEYVLPPAVAQEIVLRLQEVLAKWRYATIDNGSVIQLRPRH